MATADELLSAMTNSEEDRVLVIDTDLRTIIIPKIISTLGVEADGDVHRLQFRMPRMYGSTDLSTFNIRINYMNANSEGDIYVVTDKKVLTSSITFTWLVGSHALAYKGDVNFIVCLKESNSDGTVLREFNTTVTTLPVLEGLEVDAAPLEGELTDVLEQLLSLTVAKVAEVEAAGTAQITKVQEESSNQQDIIVEKGKEVLATIPEDYQTTTKLAEEGVRTKADAIICSAEGETIVVSDSSDDSLRGLQIFGKTTQNTTTGKNLLQHSFDVGSHTIKGITFEIREDGSVVCNGTATDPATLSFKQYNLTEDIIVSGCPANGDTQTYRITVDTYKDDAYVRTEFDLGSSVTIYKDRADYVKINIYFYTGIVANGLVFYPMVRLASVTDDIYEPYTGGIPAPNPDYPQELVSIENPTMRIFGKNLLPKSATNEAYAGLTIVVNDDQSITVNGTATDVVYYAPFRFTFKSGMSYVVSGCPTGGSNDTYFMYINNLGGVRDYGDGALVRLDNDFTSDVGFCIRSGSVINNLTFYPMVRMANTQSGYEESNIQSISSDCVLPGIPVTSGGNYTDENGQQWICDEIDFERGVYVQRLNTLDLSGDVGWLKGAADQQTENTNLFYCYPINKAKGANNVMCDSLPVRNVLTTANDFIGIFGSIANQLLYARVNGQYTLSEFKVWIAANPITVLYELIAPIETPLTADEIATFQALKSNYPNTTVLNDAGAWMSVKYNADTKTWITNLVNAKIAAAVANL